MRDQRAPGAKDTARQKAFRDGYRMGLRVAVVQALREAKPGMLAVSAFRALLKVLRETHDENAAYDGSARMWAVPGMEQARRRWRRRNRG